VVGEAQEIESPRAFPPFVVVRVFWPPERDETGLSRVEGETELAESLRQHFEHPPSVVLPREADDEVIGVPDEKRVALQARLDVALEPLVQHLVEVDVRKER
jgi:hypothetical protein